MDDTLIERFRVALQEAIAECTEHNEEYHHRTSEAVLSDWKSLVSESENVGSQLPLPRPARKKKLKDPA